MENDASNSGSRPGHAGSVPTCPACAGHPHYRQHDADCDSFHAAWQRLDDALRNLGDQLRLAVHDHWPSLLALYVAVVLVAIVVTAL